MNLAHINKLLDAAKRVQGIPSDNKLAQYIGLEQSLLCHWRKGRQWPTLEQVALLAELAEKDAAEAVVRALLNTARRLRTRRTERALSAVLRSVKLRGAVSARQSSKRPKPNLAEAQNPTP
jgi:hypothetical protein